MLNKVPRSIFSIGLLGSAIISVLDIYLNLILHFIGDPVVISAGEKLSGILLYLTLLAVIWYSEETRKLRVSASNQIDIALAPYLTVGWDPARSHNLYIKNMGKGIAVDVRFERTPEFNLSSYWRTSFNFKKITSISPESQDGVNVVYSAHSEPTGRTSINDGIPVPTTPTDYMDPHKSTYCLNIKYRDIAGRIYKTTVRSDTSSNQGFFLSTYESPSFHYSIML